MADEFGRIKPGRQVRPGGRLADLKKEATQEREAKQDAYRKYNGANDDGYQYFPIRGHRQFDTYLKTHDMGDKDTVHLADHPEPGSPEWIEFATGAGLDPKVAFNPTVYQSCQRLKQQQLPDRQRFLGIDAEIRRARQRNIARISMALLCP